MVAHNLHQEKNSLYRTMSGATPQVHFLYYAMQSLRENGRAAVITSNGLLSDMKKGAVEVKKKLFEECNLHTIIRLPESIFEPYNSIETNILFFEKGTPTTEIWYYKMKVPERVEPSYGITKEPILADFDEVSQWMTNKPKNKNAWLVKIEDIKNFDLNIKNPNDIEKTKDVSPHELISQIITDEKKTLKLLEDVEELIDKEIPK